MIERDPIVTAKEVATLDLLSGGRVLFGVGAGWNLEEMRNHGTDPSRRFRLMRERVEAMKAIWTEDEAEYHGEHVDFDPIWSWPKPVAEAAPAGAAWAGRAKVLDRVLAYGDEWMPNRLGSPEELAARGSTSCSERAGRPARAVRRPPASSRRRELVERLRARSASTAALFYVLARRRRGARPKRELATSYAALG